MWVYPDLLDDSDQGTTIPRKRSKGKCKQSNIVIASTLDSDSDVNSLTDSEKEKWFWPLKPLGHLSLLPAQVNLI